MKVYRRLKETDTFECLFKNFNFGDAEIWKEVNKGKLTNNQEIVEYLLNHGWKMMGVTYVGGCKASGYHIYHFEGSVYTE